MKQFFFIFTACLIMEACNNDTKVTPLGSQPEANQYDGIKVADLQSVSISYDIDGYYLPALNCTDQGSAVNTLATRGDLCVSLVIINTSNSNQCILRRDFLIDFDGRAIRTPTAIYNDQQRSVDFIKIDANNNTTITLYYRGLMVSAYPQWQRLPEDHNALYSIDIRIGKTATYLIGFDLYATNGNNQWILRNNY